MRRNIALSRSYREDNLEGFRARYVFATSDGKVGTTACFENGDMKVFEEAADDFTVRVRFKDAAALRRFLFAENQDVLNSLLNNEVELDGNLNYIYGASGFWVGPRRDRVGGPSGGSIRM